MTNIVEKITKIRIISEPDFGISTDTSCYKSLFNRKKYKWMKPDYWAQHDHLVNQIVKVVKFILQKPLRRIQIWGTLETIRNKALFLVLLLLMLSILRNSLIKDLHHEMPQNLTKLVDIRSWLRNMWSTTTVPEAHHQVFDYKSLQSDRARLPTTRLSSIFISRQSKQSHTYSQRRSCFIKRWEGTTTSCYNPCPGYWFRLFQ